MIIPAILGALTSALSAYAWVRYGQRWTPDYELYTQGGFGLYPSPVGRLLGMVEPVFVSASVAAAGTVVYCAAMTRGKNLSGSATPRGLVLVLSPFVLYLTFVSADVIALGMYALFLGSRRWQWLALASVTHLAVIPYALLHVVATDRLRSLHKLVIGYFVGGSVVVVLWATPYGGIIGQLDPTAMLAGLGLAVLVGLPAFLFYRPGLLHWCAFAVGTAECGIQSHAQARYFLPAILLLAVTGERRGLLRTPSGGSYRWGLTPKPASMKIGVAPGQGVVLSGSSTEHLRHIEEGTLR